MAAQGLEENRREIIHALDQMLAAEGVEGGEAGSAGDRMPGHGEAVLETAGSSSEGSDDMLTRYHSAKRRIPRGHSLGKGEDIGHHTEVADAERRAGPPEAGDHL